MVEPQLGQRVKDAATGFTGIVHARVHRYGYGTQYDVQPEGDGKTMPVGYMIDPFQLDIVDNGVMDRLPKEREPILYKLGQVGKDKIGGLKGTITAITESMNGCVSVTLVTKAKKDKGKTYTMIIPQSRFEPDPEAKTEPAPERRTGGPIRKSERI